MRMTSVLCSSPSAPMLTSFTIQATLPLPQRENGPESTPFGFAPPLSRQSPAVLPFVVGAARGGLWFASLGSGGAGVGLAMAAAIVLARAAIVLARLVARATTLEGLAGLVLGAFVAGTAGLAVARGLLGSPF